ncbi:hypothetical protein Agub_g1535 [Astrephomene gubernaculifera]|uniref:AB hydrolase-1 domain-containing protein n=1 Tax=Astrephomene gubernaculifera TaxID=47775 RepID=A0AAD3DHQ4_9CHLO|nr:hypothetical protein Agub_g1535 [Astrephomene gubernaculifera]
MAGMSLTDTGAKELLEAHPRLAAFTFPNSHAGQTVLLPSSGRQFGYCEYVDTSVPSEQLRNVVLLPGIPGSRLFTHPDVRKHGCVKTWRLIVLERPGIGLSDPAPEQYAYADFVADFREFCQQLGLRRVAVMGFSAGTPFATAIACVQPQQQTQAAASSAAKAPDAAKAGADGDAAAGGKGSVEVEVAGVALISAIGPPDTPNKRRGMALMFQFAYWACTYAPWMVSWVVRHEATAFRRRPVHAIRQALSLYDCPADVEALKRPEVEELFLESAMEIYSRAQEGAVHRENVNFAGRPWGFDLKTCRTPVTIWQGGKDKGCTVNMATHLEASMGPGVKATIFPDEGHMVYFNVWDQVVGWINGL